MALCLFGACAADPQPDASEIGSETGGYSDSTAGTAADLGDDSSTFGDSLEALGAYAGYFEGQTENITVTCESGTPGCGILQNGVLTFTQIKEDSVYSVSGQLRGSIVIDVGDACKLDLELKGLSLVSDSTNPITVLSGDKVSITAKNGYENFIYDIRQALEETEDTVYSGAIHSEVDLEICGKGSLTVVSENNNGIHSKDDLEVKNLSLLVACGDNALKGNDSVTLESGTTTLIATKGDGIKTSNSDISQKGNQRGTIRILGGIHRIYAACDGLDAAYDVRIEGEETELSVFTDKYSNYSKEVTVVSEDVYYIRFTSSNYQYSVQYYNSDSDYYWVTAQYHSKVSGGRNNYYYYSYPKMTDYSKVRFFIYSSEQKTEQDTDYLVASDYLTPSAGYDTWALTQNGNSLYYDWTNYTTNLGGMGGMGGPGGMNEGNRDKGDYSAKGIKAANAVTILAGTVAVKAYDDAIHANADSALENGEDPLGNVTVTGGNITLYSNDDGIHADNALQINGGSVTVTNSYEGLEGATVGISNGAVSVTASDDGINSCAASGIGIAISGGVVYIHCGGDGMDANSRTAYEGVMFSGGKVVSICTSGMNSAIDTEQGYTYTGGSVLAVMPFGGMTNEATHCADFSKIGTGIRTSVNSGSCLTVKDGQNDIVTVRMPVSMSAVVIYLGSSSAEIAESDAPGETLDSNGIRWN